MKKNTLWRICATWSPRYVIRGCKVQKVKKSMIIFVVIFSLFGCSHQNSGIGSPTINNTDMIVTTAADFEVTTTVSKLVTSAPSVNYPMPDYHQQLMNGDFSVIAGEYVNSNGELVIINNKGLRTGELTDGKVFYVIGMYQMNIFAEGQSDGGYMISIYPVGVEISYPLGEVRGVIDTDISKVRICYGQDYPNSEEDIYYKKGD